MKKQTYFERAAIKNTALENKMLSDKLKEVITSLSDTTELIDPFLGYRYKVIEVQLRGVIADRIGSTERRYVSYDNITYYDIVY